MHRFADEILAQDRPESGATVATAGERRSSGPFQLDVASPAVAVQHLAQEDGAAVAEPGNEVAELMSGIGHRDRLGARRHLVAGERRRQPVRTDAARIDAQLRSERIIEFDQPGSRHRRRNKPREETLGQTRVAVGERSDQGRHSSDSGWLLDGISGEHARRIPFCAVRGRLTDGSLKAKNLPTVFSKSSPTRNCGSYVIGDTQKQLNLVVSPQPSCSELGDVHDESVAGPRLSGDLLRRRSENFACELKNFACERVSLPSLRCSLCPLRVPTRAGADFSLASSDFKALGAFFATL